MIRRLFASLACAAGLLAATSATSMATVERLPGWRVSSVAVPTDLPPGDEGFIQIHLFDVGAKSSNGTITVTDQLPPGVKYTGRPAGEGTGRLEPWECSGTSTVTCTNTEAIGGQAEHCIDLGVEIEKNASGTHPNVVTASGGGALGPARASNDITLSSQPAPFGLTNMEAWVSSPDGTMDTQAGSHPFEMVVSLNLNTVQEPGRPGTEEAPAPSVSEVEGFTVNVPSGFVGDPQAVPQCPARFFEEEHCPANTQIGIDEPNLGNGFVLNLPLYNLVPPAGMPAQFGFDILGVKTFLDASIRSNGDYGITENVEHLAQRDISSNQTVIWGVPTDPSHTPERCAAIEGSGACGISDSGGAETPLLTMPTACAAPPRYSVHEVGWKEPSLTSEASFTSQSLLSEPEGVTGCGKLSLDPSVSIAPDTSYADTPAGLSVELQIPQEGLTDSTNLAPADLENTEVVLPEGVVINPGQAVGLRACAKAEDAVGTLEAPSCPAASKVGTVSITTPLLPDPLEGNVYVLESNPPQLKLLMTASGAGVNLKLVGTVHLNEQTGQLVTTFEETPELPFTRFKLAFSGGAQAALATPTRCGTFTSTSDLTPWSSPFGSDLMPTSVFAIDAGSDGSACPSSLPFNPQMTAGATNDQAGGFTGFSMLLTRGDDQQRISRLQFKAPPGLLGMLSSVSLCTNAEAESNACPASSQIGHTVVESGPGPYPLVVPEPGQSPAPIYITEGYEGAPFGLSIVVPLHVGPFVLPTQRVRGKIEVDRQTAALTITTDQLPQMVSGVPTDLREVDAVIDRPQFMINPTNCGSTSFSGTAYGAAPPGVSEPSQAAAISSRFEVGSCRDLSFSPGFTASTSGKTSRSQGASLHVKLTYPHAPAGTQANIRSVRVELPKALPSRLSTLNHACVDAVFNRNPAECPSQSKVGFAKAVTPLIPVPLEGPAYFVSHGGQKFPELIVVLQGYGVTVDLAGETFISKAGITSSTFKTVPDVPVGSFELTLPQGEYSALAANTNLCAASLTMPTVFTAQNGATLSQQTPIEAEGCPNALSIVSRKIHKRTLTLKVSVPQGGELIASGKGVSKAAKTAQGRSILTLTLKERQAGKLRTKIQLRFAPSSGKQRKILRKSITVTFQ